jgi:hypothetical protein
MRRRITGAFGIVLTVVLTVAASCRPPLNERQGPSHFEACSSHLANRKPRL